MKVSARRSAAASSSWMPRRRRATDATRAKPTKTSTTLSTTATPALPAPAGMCFDAACQAVQDRAFFAAVLFPLAASAAAAFYVWNQAPSRPTSSPTSSDSPPAPPTDDRGGDRVSVTFEDPSTGTVFEGDAPPELDRAGNVALRAVHGYATEPVEEGSPGERVRVDVGEVGARSARTFVFEKLLSSPGRPSKIVAVTLSRPAGVVFAEKEGGGGATAGARAGASATQTAVVVDELLDGSPAHKRAAAAKLDPALEGSSLMPGDVLRGFTTTNFVYRGAAGALLGLGLKPPSRTVVVFGADGQSWASVKAALRRGDSSDGDMTIIVERPGTREEG